jgi:Carboxypeptidase regulatory-like domain
MKKLWLATVAVLVLVAGVWAQSGSQDELLSSEIHFVVVRDYNGKPIRNAAVVMHPVAKNGKQEKGGLELKTDGDGKASFDGIPYGKLRVQVLIQGFQTFGGDYDVNQPTTEITVKLKRPTRMYSIYEDHPNDAKDGGNAAPAPTPDSAEKPK